MCCHQDRIAPAAVHLPALLMAYTMAGQTVWLKQEAAELCSEANDAFDAIEASLEAHPHFQVPVHSIVAVAAVVACCAAGKVATAALPVAPRSCCCARLRVMSV